MRNTLKDDFLRLLNHYQGNLLKLCLLYTDRQPDNVSDLFQEIVANLWEAFPRFRGDSKPSTWLYRVAINTAFMRQRSERRMPRFMSLDDSVFNAIANPEEDKLLERLYQLIDRLDEEERSLIFLYIDNMPMRDIALIFKTNENTIKQRIKHLKQKLKKMNDDEQQ